MQRRTGPIPLARWLTSGNSDLREKAETALYHLGPDAGGALLHAAELESRWSRQQRALFLLPVEALAVAGAFYIVRTLVEIRVSLLQLLISAIVLRALWAIAEATFSRHARLRALALALARRNDLRSIGPMIDVWRPVGVFGARIHDDEIEHELNRLLPRFMAQNRLTLRNDKLVRLSRKVRQLTPARSLAKNDLTDERTDLLITLLQLFARTGGERNRSVLRRVSHLKVDGPNAELVRESAEALLTVAANTASLAPSASPLSNNGTARAPVTVTPPAVAAKPAPVGLRQR